MQTRSRTGAGPQKRSLGGPASTSTYSSHLPEWYLDPKAACTSTFFNCSHQTGSCYSCCRLTCRQTFVRVHWGFVQSPAGLLGLCAVASTSLRHDKQFSEQTTPAEDMCTLCARSACIGLCPPLCCTHSLHFRCMTPMQYNSLL